MFKRYLVLADELGTKHPNVRKHDPSLYFGIKKIFGGLVKFREHFGLEHNLYRWTETKLIAAMRARAKELGRMPKSTDFVRVSEQGLPSAQRIRDQFGSWNRALACAFEERPPQI
ncbi:MAG: homing endonuclease associated repeat-containing protein [Planctomycetota bacterium]